MQTPKRITPTFAPETRFNVETQILPAVLEKGLLDDPVLNSLGKFIELPELRGISFSALND